MDPQMLESMTSFGLMQKISSGNMYIDIAICLILPVILQHLKPRFQELWRWITSGREPSRFSRSITFIKREGYYHYDPSERNNVLQEAVLLYIGSKKDLVAKFKTADIKLVKAAVSTQSKSSCDSDSDYGSDYSADNDDDCGHELKDYKVNTEPAMNECIEVEDGVFFKRGESVEERGRDRDSRDRTIDFVLTSNAIDGHRRIDAFLNKAYKYYVDSKTARKGEDTRCLFMPFSRAKESEESDSKNNTIFKRYALSDEKTFDCFFHDQKDDLLKLVDHFLNKTGKFQIPGYPHKFGLLLYGPPGTGKTSLIKALAHYTKRSIVNVPLCKICTNQELFDVMFDQSFLVQGEDVPMRLPHNKVIFVMEDIDAAGAVVHRREPEDTSGEAMLRHALQALHAQHTSTSGGKDGSKSAVTGTQDKGDDLAVHGPFLKRNMWKDSSDDLNLAGVLNVLDGVVDSPERIIIMTTNHPEKLDPALIRPGRINKQLYLGCMRATEARRMVAHHFPETSADDLARFEQTFPDGVMVPAALEAMCAEHDTVRELATALACELASVCEVQGAEATQSCTVSQCEQDGQDVCSARAESDIGTVDTAPTPSVEVTYILEQEDFDAATVVIR